MCNVTHSYWCFDSFVTWYTHTHETHLFLAEICRLNFFDVFQISRGNLWLFYIILELYVDLHKRKNKMVMPYMQIGLERNCNAL